MPSSTPTECPLCANESRLLNFWKGSVAGAEEVAVDDRSLSQSCLSSRKVSYPFLSGRTAMNPVQPLPTHSRHTGCRSDRSEADAQPDKDRLQEEDRDPVGVIP